MHILLTDALTCPRCGPEFGLIVLADRTHERRVQSGSLGCANCREKYPVRHAVADLRLVRDPAPSPPSAAPRPAGSPDSVDAAVSADAAASADPLDAADAIDSADSVDGGADPEAAVRLAALMGLTGQGGMALVAGPGARHAAAVAALVPGLEVIAASDDPASAARGPEPGVSRVLAEGARLPLRGSLRGAALTGGADEARLREGLRVLAPGARLVVDPAPPGTADLLRGLGAEVILEQDDVAVARAPGRPVELRYNAVR